MKKLSFTYLFLILSSMNLHAESSPEPRVRRFEMVYFRGGEDKPLLFISIPFANKSVLNTNALPTNFNDELDSQGYNFGAAEETIIAKPEVSNCEVTNFNGNLQDPSKGATAFYMVLTGAGCADLESKLTKEPLIIKMYNVPVGFGKSGRAWEGVELRYTEVP